MLLTLLAVRLLGSRTVPVNAPLLKGFKESLKQAKSSGWLEERKTKVPTVAKSGKSGTKTVAVFSLTEAGERFLTDHASPEALAATATAQLAALRQSLEVEKTALRQQIVGMLSAPGKDKSGTGPTKQLKDMEKALATLAQRLSQLEARLQAGPNEAILARIDEAFAALASKIDRALSTAATTEISRTAKPSSVSRPQSPADPPRPAALPIADALHEAYEVLAGFREFEDGLVELPRLYHEARKLCPDLSAARFRQEVESLWDSRRVQLHVRNEVRSAPEPELALHRHDKLYYYIYWPRS